MNTLAIIVPIYNRLDVSRRGLGYLQSAVATFLSERGKDYDVKLIVVDDASPDGSAAWISEHMPDVRLIETEGNLWWSGAINRGISWALQHLENLSALILQNDDVLLEADWLLRLVECAERHPESLVGCATSIDENNARISYGGRMLNRWFATETMLNQNVPRKNFKPGYVSESFDLYGRGIYIPIEAIKATGLINYDAFRHRGDLDIPLRAKKAGFRLLVSYDAIVYELPEHSFALDSKKNISITEAYKALTDFRSSYNIKYIFHYSRIATHSPLQFTVFFTSNLFYNLRRVIWRLSRRMFIRTAA